MNGEMATSLQSYILSWSFFHITAFLLLLTFSFFSVVRYIQYLLQKKMDCEAESEAETIEQIRIASSMATAIRYYHGNQTFQPDSANSLSELPLQLNQDSCDSDQNNSEFVPSSFHIAAVDVIKPSFSQDCDCIGCEELLEAIMQSTPIFDEAVHKQHKALKTAQGSISALHAALNNLPPLKFEQAIRIYSKNNLILQEPKEPTVAYAIPAQVRFKLPREKFIYLWQNFTGMASGRYLVALFSIDRHEWCEGSEYHFYTKYKRKGGPVLKRFLKVHGLDKFNWPCKNCVGCNLVRMSETHLFQKAPSKYSLEFMDIPIRLCDIPYIIHH